MLKSAYSNVIYDSKIYYYGYYLGISFVLYSDIHKTYIKAYTDNITKLIIVLKNILL